MTWYITNIIAAFLMPPLNLLLLLLVGIGLLKRRPKVAKSLIMLSCALLWLCSTPIFSEAALHWLEAATKPLSDPLPGAEAIVILGGGTYYHAPEYGAQDTVNENELVRLRYGAYLYRQTKLPILLAGGNPVGNTVSEAKQMQQVMEQEFQVPVRWLEQESTTTYENARYSQRILHQAGIKKVFLVTHAVDMPRAATEFRKIGLEVVEAPTMFSTRYRVDLLAFLPDAYALRNCKRFFHEFVGMLWYNMKT